MLRTVLLVAAGLAAGFAAAYWLAGSWLATEPTTRLVDSTPPPVSELPGRIVDLERQLGAEIEKRAALEQRVQELGSELAELHAAAPAARSADTEPSDSPQPTAAADAAAGQRFARNFRAQTTEQRVSMLEEGGFSPDRAAWIEQRRSELQLQAMQAQYAQRRGESVDAAQLRPEQTLRQRARRRGLRKVSTGAGAAYEGRRVQRAAELAGREGRDAARRSRS